MIEPRFFLAFPFSEGLGRVVPDTIRGSGYINKTGELVIQPQFVTGMDFSEGLAIVFQAAQANYIDQSGKIVLTVDKARWGFSDGLTIAGDSPNRVYVDKKGQVVAPYDVGSEF